MTAQSAAAEPAIALRGVSKSFGATQALKPMDLDIHSGRIHALVGENGAGKSTCLGVAGGRLVPSSGTVRIFGQEMRKVEPRQARGLGLATIYQELTIVPALSARANVFLGHPMSRFGLLDERDMNTRFDALCARMNVVIPADALAGNLSTAQQQLLEIMRALAVDARAILLDEPTSSLDEGERESLYTVLRDLRDEGHALGIVSHNLDEVLALTDTVTVFRDGHLVEERPTTEWTKPTLVGAMLGTENRERLGAALEHGSGAARSARTPGAVLLSARVDLPGRVDNVSIELRSGEILGIAGLVGAGRTSLLRALAGLEPYADGECTMDGEPGPLPSTPRAALKRGIAMIPEDRKVSGLVLDMSAADNIVLGAHGTVARRGIVSRRALKRQAKALSKDVGFNGERVGEHARWLSGGNQQKLLVARWRHRVPRVLLADEPTRGVDIGAKTEILDGLEETAARGGSVIVVSSELEEVVAISDRVIVLAQGRHVATFERGPECTVPAVLHAAFDFGQSPVPDPVT